MEATLLQHTHSHDISNCSSVVVVVLLYKIMKGELLQPAHVSDEEVGQQVVVLNTSIQLHQEEAEMKHTQ